jgi:ATP synthase protein I
MGESPKSSGSGFIQTLKEIGPYASLGTQLAAAVIVFVFLGRWLDDELDTKPLYMVIGAIVGISGGMIKFYRSIIELDKKESSKK